MHTPFESWSMGKSLTGMLMGVLIQQGAYELNQPAPVPEWQGDARREIRISGHHANVQWHTDPRASGPGLQPGVGGIRIICIFIPDPTPFSGRRHARSSGRPIPWAGIAIPIPC